MRVRSRPTSMQTARLRRVMEVLSGLARDVCTFRLAQWNFGKQQEFKSFSVPARTAKPERTARVGSRCTSMQMLACGALLRSHPYHLHVPPRPIGLWTMPASVQSRRTGRGEHPACAHRLHPSGPCSAKTWVRRGTGIQRAPMCPSPACRRTPAGKSPAPRNMPQNTLLWWR